MVILPPLFALIILSNMPYANCYYKNLLNWIIVISAMFPFYILGELVFVVIELSAEGGCHHHIFPTL